MLGNTLVGRYQIISHLGGGGFGETFVACDTQLPGSPKCVVKKLKPQTKDPVALRTARRFFETEAQVLHKLGTHDHIPQLLAYFEEDEEFYLVQEFISGHDLGEELTLGKILTEDEVIDILQEILEILEYVHQQQVIHRDINPRNLLRQDQTQKLFLIDFGAVKQITTQVIVPEHTKLTVVIGTPGYIPSEQAQGNPKFSSDIYAVGIIGIQALTGLSPEQLDKDGESNEIIWHHASVSPEMTAVLDKMVRYDFRQRYPSATLALQALKELRNPNSATIALSPPSTPQNQQTNQQVSLPIKNIITKTLIGLVVLGAGLGISNIIFHVINSANANELYKQANTFYDLQHYEDALTAYEQVVKLKPNYSQAWDGEGKTLYQLKEYKSALTAYDHAIQIKPDYADAWNGRGITLSKLNRYSEAINAFGKALQLQNNNPEIWNAQGEAFSNLKQYDQAIKSFEKAIQLKSDDNEAWYNKGWALQNLKRYSDAIAAYNKAVEIKPDDSQAWYNLGNTLFLVQRYQDAFAAYDKAVQYKVDYYQAWLSRGNVLLQMRRYPEAIESYNQVIKYNPSIYLAWYDRGWSLQQLQRYDEAVASYDKAIAIKHNDYEVWYNRGNALYNSKKYSEALTSYNRAIRYKPDDYELWFSKGNTLFALKQYQDAIVSYNQAIKLKPDFQQAIDARNQAQSQLPANNQWSTFK